MTSLKSPDFADLNEDFKSRCDCMYLSMRSFTIPVASSCAKEVDKEANKRTIEKVKNDLRINDTPSPMLLAANNYREAVL